MAKEASRSPRAKAKKSAALAPAVAAQSGLPAGTLPRERLQVITAALAVTDPLRHIAGRAAAITTGQRLITAMLDCLPAAGPCPGGRDPMASAATCIRLSLSAKRISSLPEKWL